MRTIDLPAEIIKVREEMAGTSSETKLKRLSKRLKLIESFVESGNKPEWMVLTVLPVLPPDLRPLVPLDGGRFATSDLNDLYRRVINRNNRLRRLLELNAPDIIVRNEKRMLQEAVDALLDNGRRGRAITGTNKRPLKSLADMIKGKQGRFRQNLLGKRVDYSGRSVIVVGPQLRLHQCGLPKKMALELFKPFIFQKLQLRGEASTIKAAKRLVEREGPEVWDILEEVIREHPVLLEPRTDAAPPGHPGVRAAAGRGQGDPAASAGVHGVQRRLRRRPDGRARAAVARGAARSARADDVLQQHPLAGQRRPDHRALAGRGARPVLHDARAHRRHGRRHVLRRRRRGAPCLREPRGRPAGASARCACASTSSGEGGTLTERRASVDTTVGRALLFEILPKGLSFDLINQDMTKKAISATINACYRALGLKETVVFADQLMYTGFHYATRAGVSFGIDDIVIPEQKTRIVAAADDEVKEIQDQYASGLVTNGERYNKVVDIWSRANDQVAKAMMEKLGTEEATDSRGAAAQAEVLQLDLHDGRLRRARLGGADPPARRHARPDGQARRLDHRDADHGELPRGPERPAVLHLHARRPQGSGRHGAEDRELRLPDPPPGRRGAGPGGHRGSTAAPPTAWPWRRWSRAATWSRRSASACSAACMAEDILKPGTEEVLIPNGTLLDEKLVRLLETEGVDQIKVRSPITCETRYGVCSHCYGRDLARGRPISIGEAVGVIAAQSIGEPGTQLTMRTFHIGGAASRAAAASTVEVRNKGVIRFHHVKTVQHEKGHLVAVSRSGEIGVVDDFGRERERYKIPYGAMINVKEGATVAGGQVVATWDPHTHPVVTEVAGLREVPGLRRRPDRHLAGGRGHRPVLHRGARYQAARRQGRARRPSSW